MNGFAAEHERRRRRAEAGDAIHDRLQVFGRWNEYLEHEAILAGHAMDLYNVLDPDRF